MLSGLHPALAVADGPEDPLSSGRVITVAGPERLVEVAANDGTERPASDEQRFQLEAVVVEGNTVYSDSELDAVWDPVLFREVGLADLNASAARLTAMYRSDGYLLTKAIVPAQVISEGVARVQVVEGYVSEVRFEPADGISDLGQLPHVRARRLESSTPLRGDIIDRFLLLLNDLPGVSARGILSPSESVPGSSILTVKTGRAGLSGYFDVNNRGNRFFGPYQTEAALRLNSPFERNEAFEFRFRSSMGDNRLRLFSASTEHQLGSYGTTLALLGTYAETEPGEELAPLEQEATSVFVSGVVSHPAARTRRLSVHLRASLDYLDSDTDFFFRELAANDRITSARLAAHVDYVDKFRGINRAEVQLSQGLDLFGPTETGSVGTSRRDGKHNYTKVTAQLFRLQRVFPAGRLNLLVGATGQLASGSLLSAEEFAFGGENFGRGYDRGEIVGDSGLGFLSELQYPLVPGKRFLRSLQLFASWDVGRTWQRGSAEGLDKRSSGASGALGVRVNFTESLSGIVMAALPLTRPATFNGETGRQVRGFFALTARY